MTISQKLTHILGLTVLLYVVSVQEVFAQVTVVSIITQFTAALAPLAGALVGVAVVVFLWGMVVFITQSGDDNARAAGRQRMIWGVVALFTIVSVWGIVSLLGVLFGVDASRTNCNAPYIFSDHTSSGCSN